jgi:hypothetical protein
VNVNALAQRLPDSAFHNISWRDGSNERPGGRFAALQMRLCDCRAARLVIFDAGTCSVFA